MGYRHDGEDVIHRSTVMSITLLQQMPWFYHFLKWVWHPWVTTVTISDQFLKSYYDFWKLHDFYFVVTIHLGIAAWYVLTSHSEVQGLFVIETHSGNSGMICFHNMFWRSPGVFFPPFCFGDLFGDHRISWVASLFLWWVPFTWVLTSFPLLLYRF